MKRHPLQGAAFVALADRSRVPTRDVGCFATGSIPTFDVFAGPELPLIPFFRLRPIRSPFSDRRPIRMFRVVSVQCGCGQPASANGGRLRKLAAVRREAACTLCRRQKTDNRRRTCRCGCRYRTACGRGEARNGSYFLDLGASIMFIFLPSSLGIISTLATSSRSVAKRSSRISPCSLKTIERPRKKT